MRELQPTVGCRMTQVLGLAAVQLLTLPPVRRRVKMAVQRLEEEELGAVVEERFPLVQQGTATVLQQRL